jgi:hypothetical protein
MTDKPLLLIDVDGCLNPEPRSNGRRPEGYQTHRFNPTAADGVDWVTRYRKPLRVWLNPEHGVQLLQLAELYELTWCTTWEHEANEWIAPHLGLPELPVVEFGKNPPHPPEPGLHWKTATIIEYAAGRPFVWVDDEVSQRDMVYIDRHQKARFAIMRIQAQHGLEREHFLNLEAWHEEWTIWTKAMRLINPS